MKEGPNSVQSAGFVHYKSVSIILAVFTRILVNKPEALQFIS